MSLTSLNESLEDILGTSSNTITENLTALVGYVSESYDAVDTCGGTVPEDENTENLADAIDTIGEENE